MARCDKVVVIHESSLSDPLLPEQAHDSQNRDDFQYEDLQSTSSSEPRISRNVPLALAYTAFAFAGRSIWSQSVLSAFVFLMRGEDYRAVGSITAVMGLAQLVTSFPSGFLADRYRRDTLLRTASFVALLAIAATLYAIYTNDLNALVVGLAVWGTYWGIANTALTAIFADSVPSGQRAKYFTQRSLLVTLGNAFGPVVSLVLFAALGDKWGIKDCAFVMAVGQFICLPAVVLLCFMSDDHTQKHQDEGTSSLTRDITTDDDDDDDGSIESDLSVPTGQAFESIQRNCDDTQPPYSFWRFLCSRRIAVLIATGDMVSGLASGMSIRYFPIFFAENLGMSPVMVQVLYALTPLFLACTMKLAQIASVRFGRCRVSVLFKWTGVFLMWTLAIVYRQDVPRWLVCTIYILRTAFMNSTSALTRSVLMDHVPPSERARWAALESFNMFSWSGSAALGGYLVGTIGMVPLFCTTAAIQFLATFPLVFLSTDKTVDGQTDEPSNQNTLTQPLLTDDTTEQRRRGSV